MKKRTPCTKATDQNNLLTSDEVCSILKACAESKVRELKFGGLYVSFGPQALEEQIHIMLPPAASEPVAPTSAPPPVAEMTEAQHTIQTSESLAQAEIEAKEDQLALLAIENPVEFERQLMNGELEDGPSAESDDEEA